MHRRARTIWRVYAHRSIHSSVMLSLLCAPFDLHAYIDVYFYGDTCGALFIDGGRNRDSCLSACSIAWGFLRSTTCKRRQEDGLKPEGRSMICTVQDIPESPLSRYEWRINALPQGPLTTAHIYEILPFENSLCVLTLDGATLRELLENIAARGGEGVSGVRLEISSDGKLLRATIGGKPVDEARTYTVATLDYLAEGNDGMRALPKASDRQCPPGATLRGLFMDYVKRQTAEGRPLRAQVEGRIVMRK